jgi:hypothetical protein
MQKNVAIILRDVLPNLVILKMKYNFFNHPSIFFPTDWRENIEIWQCLLLFFSPLEIENLQNQFIWKFLILIFGKMSLIFFNRFACKLFFSSCKILVIGHKFFENGFNQAHIFMATV